MSRYVWQMYPTPTRHYENFWYHWLWVFYGYLIYRPIHHFYWRCSIHKTLIWYPKLHKNYWAPDWPEWKLPNYHWWVFYHIFYLPIAALYGGSPRKLWWMKSTTCNGYLDKRQWVWWLLKYPRKFSFWLNMSFSCPHCGSKEFDSDNEGYFELVDSGAQGTEDGTNYWHCGFVYCPRCHQPTWHHEDSL
jgi:hypothetical protein